MPENESKMIESVKRDIVTTIEGTGDIAQAAVDTVTKTLGSTVKEFGKTGSLVAGAAENVAKAMIHGATDVGADLGHVAKGTVIGVLRASKHIGAEAIDSVDHASYALIHGTSEVGGELGQVATGAVEGAISVAKEVGVCAEEAAAAAAHGALEAADKIGSKALNTVRDAMKETICGVKVVLKPPFNKAPRQMKSGKRT